MKAIKYVPQSILALPFNLAALAALAITIDYFPCNKNQDQIRSCIHLTRKVSPTRGETRVIIDG
jgi:hypothetical protein